MGANRLIKVLMIVFNVLFLIPGLALIGAGIWMLVDASTFRTTLSNNFGVSANITDYFAGAIIGIGGIVAVVSFLGCCGAIKESSCMLHCFNVFLVIFILLEIGIAAAVWYFAPNLKTYLEEPAKSVIKNTYGLPDQESLTSLYDSIQKAHSCCGFNDGDDFEDAAYLKIPGAPSFAHPWPQSCCKANATESECRDNSAPLKSNNENGCFNFVQNLLKQYSDVVGGVMVGLAALHILAMVFAYCITCSSGKNSVSPY